MASSPRTNKVVMYSRRKCGLCDAARTSILAERQHTDFSFREVFIDGNEGLEREYGLRVPVVEVNGREEFEYEVEPLALRQALAAGG